MSAELAPERWSGTHELARLAAAHTPARLFVGGTVSAYSTATALKLRADHAAARDAVDDQIDRLETSLASLPTMSSQATDRTTYLANPGLGRLLTEESRVRVAELSDQPADVQIVIGDGLSADAVRQHGPTVLTAMHEEAESRGWRVAPPFVVHQCRVGILNDIGPLVSAPLIILLIGERPGLAIADSMSAYFAWKPGPGATDAHRNLISNIHARGVPPAEAGARIIELGALIARSEMSGVSVKEVRVELPSGGAERLGSD
ncbi:ethanolamine ammonia-lyase subunit EutC [soil metagenome]